MLAVGPEALSMIKDANMLILFGEEAPQDLADYCYKIDNKNLSGHIKRAGILLLMVMTVKLQLLAVLLKRI